MTLLEILEIELGVNSKDTKLSDNGYDINKQFFYLSDEMFYNNLVYFEFILFKCTC